jgi:hypothetical protein
LDFDYSLFGLIFRFNIPITQLLSVQSSGAIADAEVHLRSFPPGVRSGPNGKERLLFASSDKTETNQPTHQLWRSANKSLLRLEFCDGTQFWLNSNGTHLWSVWPQTVSLENALGYLLGPVLGFLLRLRGVVCLHASAVAVGNRCAVFVGAQGAGKSTTAAALAREGCPVLSDDVVALDEREGRFRVQPSYPHVLLWPDSVQRLFGSADALPNSGEDGDKRRLTLGNDGSRYQGQALPLGAVYILGQRTTASTLEPLSRSCALVHLIAHSYAAGLLEPEKRAQEFETFGRLIDTVPVRSLTVGSDTHSLSRLYRLLQHDLRPS